MRHGRKCQEVEAKALLRRAGLGGMEGPCGPVQWKQVHKALMPRYGLRIWRKDYCNQAGLQRGGVAGPPAGPLLLRGPLLRHHPPGPVFEQQLRLRRVRRGVRPQARPQLHEKVLPLQAPGEVPPNAAGPLRGLQLLVPLPSVSGKPQEGCPGGRGKKEGEETARVRKNLPLQATASRKWTGTLRRSTSAPFSSADGADKVVKDGPNHQFRCFMQRVEKKLKKKKEEKGGGGEKKGTAAG